MDRLERRCGMKEQTLISVGVIEVTSRLVLVMVTIFIEKTIELLTGVVLIVDDLNAVNRFHFT